MSIPSELLEQGILLGTATSKGKTYDVYYASNINVRSLPKIVIGIQDQAKLVLQKILWLVLISMVMRMLY